MRGQTALAVIASVLAHAVLLHGLAKNDVAPRRAPTAHALLGLVAAKASDAVRFERLAWQRRLLVEQARDDLLHGRLSLGRFVLAANQLDAQQQGHAFDFAQAQARYEDRLGALHDALAHQSSAQDLHAAVADVLGDLRYYGQPGGLMGDALLDGGGSCEQVSHLVASLVYDVGFKDLIALRFYGGAMAGGATHLAPVSVGPDGETDLMTGREAVAGGSRFAAEELVEVYARAHGLAPPKPSSTPSSTTSHAADLPEDPASSPRPTLVSGYPPNLDRYPGSLPLYASRAIQPPNTAADEPTLGQEDQARNCAYFVRMAILDPPVIEIQRTGGQAGDFDVEPYRIPRQARLERDALLLGSAEVLAGGLDSTVRPLDPEHQTDRLMGLACLAALGQVASVDFTLVGERSLATVAKDKERKAREQGKQELARIRDAADIRASVKSRLSEQYAGQTWLLLALEGGDDIVLELVQSAKGDDWGKVSALAALVVWPETRTRAYSLLQRLSLQEQIDVMHEIFHAHDHQRPWASNFEIDELPDTGQTGVEFRRVYRVFRALAFRLWEGQRAPEEILEALPSDAYRAGIGEAWEAALLEYYVRNALGLYSNRPGGFELVRVLRKAVIKNGHPSLEGVERKLAYIESQSRLDATTLADAWRRP